MEQMYIGIDVGKEKLDVYIEGKYLTLENNKEGLCKLVSKINKLGSALSPFIICEATGGYEKLLINFLREKMIAYHVVHPNKVRAFAKSKGVLAKTDKVDSKILQDFAMVFKPESDLLLLSENEIQLSELIKRREQLIQEKVREKNRLDKIFSIVIEKSIQKHIIWLENEIEKLEKNIDEIEKKDTKIHTKVDLLTSIPSIGKIVAYNLITFLPELGTLTHREIAALVGVAPMNRESGKYRGKRFIQGGRAKVRKYLYMSALTSISCYKEMKEFHQKLKAKGKPGKLILTAIMRKLLMVLNSIVKRQTPWTINNELKSA
jgi:transposase